MSDFTPQKPDYTVSAMDKDRDTTLKGQIGVAWKNANGSIRIKINPFVVLNTREHDLVITLFPIGQQQQYESRKKTSKEKDLKKELSDDFDAFKDETPPY